MKSWKISLALIPALMAITIVSTAAEVSLEVIKVSNRVRIV